VAQTLLSVSLEAGFEDYTGKNACATKEECTHLFLNESLRHKPCFASVASIASKKIFGGRTGFMPSAVTNGCVE